MHHTIDARHPRGSVLLFTMIIMLLMGLLGFAIFLNTSTELQVSRDTNLGRSTFSKADAAARLGLLFSRAALTPSAGSPSDYIRATLSSGTRPPFEVTLASDFSLDDFNSLNDTVTVDDIRDRYLRTTEAPGYDSPPLTLSYDNKVVGTVAMDINQNETTPVGGSLEDEGYDKESGSTVTVYLVIAADGRMPTSNAANAGNYFTGDLKTTHNIINTIYREVLP